MKDNSRLAFTDTSAWLAVINKNNQFHEPAGRFLKTQTSLVTSSWVVEEFVAHLHARYGLGAAYKGVEFMREFPALEVVYLDRQLLESAFALFEEHGSAGISLVDVSNVVLMESLGMERIFAFDRRFESIFAYTLVPGEG